MIARELILSLRRDFLRDRIAGGAFENDKLNLWQNDELLGHIDNAADEACLRARLLVDSTTAEICTLAVTADDPFLTVDPRVNAIDRIKLASMDVPLVKKSTNWLDANVPKWEDITERMSYFIWDNHLNKLQIVGIPAADDTASLTVWRRPLVPLLMDAAPEIPEEHHKNLLHWASHLAYLKTNSNTYSQEKSDYHGSMFARYFGERPSASIMEGRRRHYAMRSPARYF